MKKIYLVIAGAFLILLIITTLLLSLQKKTTTDAQKNLPLPTSIPEKGINGQQVNNQPSSNTVDVIEGDNNQDPSILLNQSNTSFDISTISPVETDDFKLMYSTKLGKLIIEKKTPQAEEAFKDWAISNNVSELVNNSEKTLFVELGENPDEFNPLIDFLNIFMNVGQSQDQSNENNSPSDSVSITSDDEETDPSDENKTPTGFTYYAQCGDQGSTPLPGGGTLCSAGCGPTTVAMIVSSYVGKQYDPKAIVNLYDKNNYLLSGAGSRYSDAHELLNKLGLKTTDYIVFDYEKSDTVVPQLRKYLNAGWTFFTLASFCSGGCGHFFWVTDIDAKGNIWAYDPAYGRFQIPYNENSRYPYPQYRLAFGVKR